MKAFNKISLTVCSLAIFSLAAPSAFAASASATGNSTATVITPIGISQTTAMAFGDFAAGTGGTVVMAADGTRTSTGDVSLSSSGGGNAAVFAITGQSNYTFTITLPSSAITLGDGASGTMLVATFVSSPNGTGTLSSGSLNVNVGATITVGNAQTAGSYTGTYSVSVDYN